MINNKSFTKQIIALLFFTSLALSFSSCKKDSLETVSLDTPNPLSTQIQSEIVAADGITSSSYYLVNALPSGYVKDGSRDYTSYVQAAVTKYSNVVFPGFPILVNEKGITIGSNKTITFQEGSEVRLKGTSSSSYNIFNIINSTNITLYNPVIKGDRNSHVGTGGEFGMGIGIRGSSNISIYNAKITDCWGDGIYIGQSTSVPVCKNIIIKDAYLSKNRRDGISIISVDGLQLDNLYAGFTDGTSPWCGINFEPNNSECELKNVRINNPRTERNLGNGIQIGTSRMLASASKAVDITITNHTDISSSRYSLKVSHTTASGAGGRIAGLIKVVNPTWHKFLDRPIWMSVDQSGFKTEISSPEVMLASGSTLSFSDAYALMMKNVRKGTISILEDAPSTVENTVVTTSPSTSNVVFAVNAGGTSFQSANGITYSADKSYSGGSLYKTNNAISNTTDDAIYQTERYGKTFSYAIPVVDGTYEITFKTSENYHKASGKRRFDIVAENQEIVANLDIFAVAGFNNAYDIVKTVSVTDGTLNVTFRTDLDQAKISAFHIVKK